MSRNGRTIERPWARRRNGGWVISHQELLKLLKKADILELDGVMVGTKQLSRLVNLLPYADCQLRANGRLEIETVQRVVRSTGGKRRMGFARPKHYHQWLALVHKAWVPLGAKSMVVLKPRKY